MTFSQFSWSSVPPAKGDEDDCIIPKTAELPPLPPRFFITRMTDVPQNPIMDTLKQSIEDRIPLLPPELRELSVEYAQNIKGPEQSAKCSPWDDAKLATSASQRQVNALRASLEIVT
jgi:hypothetical protein